MNKIIGLAVVAVVVFFLFFRNTDPEYLHLNGQDYGPKTLDRTNDSLSEIYTYASKSVENNDYLIVLHPDSGTGSLDAWSDLYSKHFEKQGYTFEKVGSYKKGIKGNVILFMVPIAAEGSLVMYVVEDNAKPGIPADDSAFELLSNIQLNN